MDNFTSLPNNDNITFFLNEKEDFNENNNEDDIQKMMKEFNQYIDLDILDLEPCFQKDELKEHQHNCAEVYYDLKYTVKDLLKICSYYGIEKNIKTSKCKKHDIISTIVYFESLPENYKIVQKRYNMWSYITELLNDSKMKKFILWD